MGSHGQGGNDMTDEQRKSRIKRACEMLMLASNFIREHCPDSLVEYDDAVCDGYCLADDCETATEMLKDI